MCFMEGQGVDGHVGDDFCVVLCLQGVPSKKSPV